MTCFLLAASFRPLQRRRFPVRSRSRKNKKRKKNRFLRTFSGPWGGSSEPPEPPIATPLNRCGGISRMSLGTLTALRDATDEPSWCSPSQAAIRRSDYDCHQPPVRKVLVIHVVSTHRRLSRAKRAASEKNPWALQLDGDQDGRERLRRAAAARRASEGISLHFTSLSRIYLSRIVEKVPKNLSSYAPDQDEGNKQQCN